MHDAQAKNAARKPSRRYRRRYALAVVACSIALVSLAFSALALWRTRHLHIASTSSVTTTTVPGPALVVVPSEIDKNGMVAAGELSSANLNFEITPWPSVSTGLNRVITQDPAPGTSVPAGTSVRLKVSSGPA
jgi:hypothetical protein